MLKEIIGLVPGAMKPFHKGHYFLISKAIEECDKVLIYTSGGDRGFIKGKQMRLVWDNLIIPKPNNAIILKSPNTQIPNTQSPNRQIQSSIIPQRNKRKDDRDSSFVHSFWV